MRRAKLLAWPAAPLLAFAAGYIWFRAEAAETPEDTATRTDAIIVLTGGANRIEAALRLLESGTAPRLLVSGAAPRLTLAELARAHGRDPAALAGRVTLGHAAATTVGNAAETAAFARAHNLRSLRVVTAGYHMPRALLELRRALPGVELVPHAVAPPTLRAAGAWRRPAVWGLLLGEYGRYVLARAGLSALASPRREARDP